MPQRLLDPREFAPKTYAPQMSPTGQIGGSNVNLAGGLNAIGYGLIQSGNSPALKAVADYMATAPQRAYAKDQHRWAQETHDAKMAEYQAAQASREQTQAAYEGLLSDMKPGPQRDYLAALPAETGLTLLADLRLPKGKQPPAGYRWSDDGVSLAAIPGGPADKSENAGPYGGTGLANQDSNILINYRLKKQNGEPTTLKEDMAYALAYERQTQAQFQNINGQMFMAPGLNLAGFPVPGAAPPPSPDAVPQPPAPQSGVPQTTPIPSPGGAEAAVPPNTPPGFKPVGGIPAADKKELRTIETEVGNLEAAINDYEALLEEYGSENLDPDAKIKLKQAYNTLLFNLKGESFYNLGVLNGPGELEAIQRTLPDPTTLTAAYREYNPFGSGRDGLLSDLSGVKGMLDRAKKRVAELRGGATQRRRWNPVTDEIE